MQTEIQLGRIFRSSDNGVKPMLNYMKGMGGRHLKSRNLRGLVSTISLGQGPL